VALDTYAALQTALGVELNRTDLTGVIPDLITRFEARARRELRDWLRTTITATNVTGDYLLPVTVSDVLSVSYNDGVSGSHNFPLDLLTKEGYQRFLEASPAPAAVSGQAAYVDADIDGGTTTLRFWPPAGATAPIANLKIEVIKVLPALATASTNALLREAPDVYLNGSCAEAAKYLSHDERISMWASERDAGFRGLRIQTERRLYGGAPRRRVLPVVFG
jgi:hypothetical protein